jgi:hypothetical protein
MAAFPGIGYYAGMTQSSTKTAYIAALGYPTGNAFSDFDSITFEAADKEAAITEAIQWARRHTSGIDVRTWLQVTRKHDGFGIYSEHIGKDYA